MYRRTHAAKSTNTFNKDQEKIYDDKALEKIPENYFGPTLYKVVIKCGKKVKRSLLDMALLRFFKKECRSKSTVHYAQYGDYTRDVAETKVAEMLSFLGDDQNDLKCFIEERSLDAEQKS